MSELGVQIYTILVGLGILSGTVYAAASFAKVRPSRRPLYWLKTGVGVCLSTVFALGYLLRFTDVPVDQDLFNAFFYLSFVMVALLSITGTFIDRYEAKRLGAV